jgi:hypothetical protein
MGFFDFFRRRPPTPPKPTGGREEPVGINTALAVLDQQAIDIYYAPQYSVSGQPQNWSWRPEPITNAQPGSWHANWNALYPFMRPYYGLALAGGADHSLLRLIYEDLEGHTPAEGADLVNKMHENGRVMRIENGQLVNIKKNSNGSTTRTVVANLAYPEAPTSARRLDD